ncbi:MAG: bifunctional phosphoglucose/phosphomannose isomerase [Desulfurispora sp.]|uniref:bifunctional phosphoglucose/phosphomannose isomerase n=1 Tax=Desulfurispora sp. TaxID=3014275 RepID=UPI00404A4F0C
MDAKLLDNVQLLYEKDSKGMLKALAELPHQCYLACWELPGRLELADSAPISNIVVTGLGGSAIGGDLLRVYCLDRCSVPVLVNRDYTLPAFVGPDTLLFAVSYSGNTEETLSAYQQARQKGARIVALTTGGRLAELANQDGVPWIKIPAGLQPRAATGFLFIPTLVVLEKLGFISGVEKEVQELVEHLKTLQRNLAPEVPQESNSAKQLALKLHGRIPVVWGASGTSEVVAQRWKGQINENAKAPAYWNILPELNHNELVGFQVPPEILRQLHIVILRDPDDHPRVQKRVDITREIIASAVGGVTEVSASGGGRLARTFSLIYSGDYTSVYLAFLYGLDPGPVEVIDYLKRALASDGGR